MSPRIGVIVVVQNDSETIERCISAFYDHVEVILVSTDPRLGWTGLPVVADNTIDLVRALDRDKKVVVLSENYFVSPDPIINDTHQRQVAVDYLSKHHRGLDWIAQIDADEEFLDFRYFVSRLHRLPPWTRQIFWRWIPVFNFAEDGRLLIVVNREGTPFLEQFPLAHRPGASLTDCRRVRMFKSARLNRFLAVEYKPSVNMRLSQGVLHYTFAKSEARVLEKLKTWTHSFQFDTDKYFEDWKRSKREWTTLHDFHYLIPSRWPALRAYTREELLGAKR